MNFEELDKALRSVLLQYMCDPEVIGIIKNNVNTENVITNSLVKTDSDNTMQANTNSEKLISKINEILNGQQRIESLIKSILQNNGNENKTEDNFENAKVEYESEISKLKSENEHTIAEYKDLIARYQNKNQLLEDENSNLKSRNEEYKRAETQLISHTKVLETEISQLSFQIKSALQEKEKIQREYDFLESQYSVFVKQLKIWNSVKSLNDENKEYLEKLCGSVTAMSILSLGRDEGKVGQLWSYLKDLAVKDNQAADQIEILAGYFEFCIDLSNECKDDEEKYCLFDIEPGNEFDLDMCIRSADGKQIGNVSRTIVRGVKKGKIVRFKAIVSVD